MTHALQNLLATCEDQRSLREPDQLRQRVEMLDSLEDELFDATNVGEDLRRRATAVIDELEAINQAIYRDIQSEIRRGENASLLKWMRACAADGLPRGEGYDALDVLLSGVLPFEAPTGSIAALAPDMVFYQPTPARHIVDAIERLSLNENDVLVDLGSGLGHVPLLAAICSRARCVGIEVEPVYVACAQRCAQALQLSNASFLQQNVCAGDFSEGTVFYLYTPFTGDTLREALDRLAQEAAKRSIRLCTLGPVTSVIAREPWLISADDLRTDRVAVFASVRSK
ncbi:hypothetical protein [Dyella mobilis]|uniref:DOT1 domain-containing protein n=1 Tax=Dyella mobilis TaxID=1849582 RepID=A0ABS2KA31_9GAMM|nr:hypothetical protein [Dyella mobilis]MBM7128055.1 hypothetical protein [Dyella mobilis]GLR00052.1 hypothetical protein GCM10007863_44710 [Dyella mobilis]